MSHLDPTPPSEKPSPFLPGTKLQYVWDSTSLGWLKECPRKYQYSMLEGWRTRGTSSAHLVFGQHYHSALELYDKLRVGSKDGRKWEHDEATHEVVVHLLRWTWVEVKKDWLGGKCIPCGGDGRYWSDDGEEEIKCNHCGGTGDAYGVVFGPWVSDHPAKNRESLIRSVVWYLEEFRDDSCTTVVLANGKPAVELSFKFDSGISISHESWNESDHYVRHVEDMGGGSSLPTPSQTYVLSGHLDRLATFQGDTYVMDRKTSGTALTPHFFDQFNPHNQMSLYTIAGEVIFGTAIKGVIIDGAQVAVGFTRFGRGFTARTPALSEEYLNELEPWFRSAERYAAADFWPRNETSCGNYGGCTFRKICRLDPRVRQNFLQTEFEVNKWNPLQSRE